MLNAIHLNGVNNTPNPTAFCKSIKSVTIMVYQIHALCKKHISNKIELAINNDPPKNEESTKY